MNKTAAPKLRFPEFQDAEEWNEKTIGQISENIIAGGTPSTLRKDYWNGNIRWMNSGELNYKKVYEVQGRITEKGLQSSSTRLIPSYCVLIGLAGQGKTRGTVAMNMIELCTNQSIAAIFPNEHIFDSNFLYHNLDNRYDELRRISAGGEGRGGLNLQIIKSLKIILPSLSEQQKIADCLTSLDELITAQSQKVESLQAYKKGLMQNLFPAEGESVPRLRFPEFESAGEWEFLPLGEVGEIITGKTPSTADSTLWNGEIQFVTPTDIKNDEKYQYRTQRTISLTEKIKVLPKHSIMFTCIASIGKMAISVFPCITNQQINTLIPKDNFDNEYVYYALLSITDYIKPTQASSTLPIINKTEFSKFLIPAPSIPEQQRIAELLTAIDEQISAQSEAVEMLKSHKKGLMQGLFPSPDFRSLGDFGSLTARDSHAT